MKLLFILFISLLTIANSFAQDQSDSKTKRLLGEAIFYHDFLSYKSDKPGITRLDVFIQVPYKSVQFVKSREGFTATYSITASIYDSTKSRLIVEKTWNEKINVIDFALVTSRENFNLSKRSFEIQPGNYIIRTALEDLDSKKLTTSEIPVVVRNLGNNISLSDILLISKPDSTKSTNTIVPNITRNIYSAKDLVRFYYEINSLDSQQIKRKIDYTVTDVEKQVIHNEQEYLDIKPGVNQVLHLLKEFPFDMGAYTITISILGNEGNVLTFVSKSFYSKIKGLPALITDIDKAIRQTVYIATGDEIDYMEEGENVNEKTKRFLEYWKKKDPSPNNEENEIFEEYFRRVAYANENFSSYYEGWHTDRGMVYIILGPPNNVDRHPFEYDSKPYEVWEYYDLNKSFIFLDETGFGDYRLITPLTGDLYRYRY